MRSQLQASLSHFEGSLFSLDGQLYTGNVSPEIIHLLQSQRVLSLKLTVGLGAFSYPGGEALVGGVPGRQHCVGSCGQVMLHLRPQLLTLRLDLCNISLSQFPQSRVTPLTVRLLNVPVGVSLPAHRVPQSSVLPLYPAVKLSR